MTPATHPRLSVQRWLLRIILAILLTGLPGVIMPGEAFEKFSWLMGYGQPPLVPLTLYLSGNAGFAYVALAIMTLAILRDLERQQSLVRVYGWIMVAACPAYLSIDLQCPLPWWWILADSGGCLLLGIGLLKSCGETASEQERANGPL